MTMLASEEVARRSAHLSPIEWRFARELGVSPKDVDGPPIALIVGEAPGAQGHGRGPLAMFPYPPTSAAGRLLRFSAMPPGVFLGRFARRNLLEELPEKWSIEAARERAGVIREEAKANGWKRIVLLGRKVADAFEMDGFFMRREIHAIEWNERETTPQLAITAIPHPSGMNQLYNDENVRAAARHELMWAAGLT